LTRRRSSGVLVRIGLFLAAFSAACILALAVTELTCRALKPEWLAVPHALFPLIQHDPTVGWTRIPNTSGVFTNDHFRGFVSNDALGNRQNARETTYVEGDRNILFVGDSATASLEVNDDETIPARLEQGLRRRGEHVNVLNLGVRGYGADQAFARAIQMSERYHPTDIVFLYTDGDMYDDNVLGPATAELTKSAWVRGDDGRFHIRNDPVPVHVPGYRGVVLLDEKCHPVVYEHMEPVSPFWMRVHERAWDFYTYRIYREALEKVQKKFMRDVENDPYTEVMKFGFHRDFSHEYGDEGVVRHRCGDYLDDQMRFLVEHLRAHAAGSPRIHVILFPDRADIAMLKRHEDVPSIRLFESMLAERRIDDFVNLPAQAVLEGTDLRDMRCPGDSHLCAAGNLWVATHALASLHLGSPN
jgi:hypothetical protein